MIYFAAPVFSVFSLVLFLCYKSSNAANIVTATTQQSDLPIQLPFKLHFEAVGVIPSKRRNSHDAWEWKITDTTIDEVQYFHISVMSEWEDQENKYVMQAQAFDIRGRDDHVGLMDWWTPPLYSTHRCDGTFVGFNEVQQTYNFQFILKSQS